MVLKSIPRGKNLYNLENGPVRRVSQEGHDWYVLAVNLHSASDPANYSSYDSRILQPWKELQ